MRASAASTRARLLVRPAARSAARLATVGFGTALGVGMATLVGRWRVKCEEDYAGPPQAMEKRQRTITSPPAATRVQPLPWPRHNPRINLLVNPLG
jgi:hypothetical protein